MITTSRRLAVVLAAFLGLGLIVGPGAADGMTTQSTFERITSFRSDINVDRSGDLSVTESISYDFGPNSRHGIERYVINTRRLEPTPSDGGRRFEEVIELDGISVVSPSGAPDDVETEQMGDALRIRVGDPDQTVRGTHTYVIRYRVSGVSRRFADHDEIYWNVTGNRWVVSMSEVTARVVAPVEVTQASCFAGPVNSRIGCASAQAARTEANFSQGEVGAGSGLTIVVALPRGTLADVEPHRKEVWTVSRAFPVTAATAAGAAGLLAAVVGIVGWLLARNARDRRYLGSAVDAAFGSPTGDHGPVPIMGAREPDTVEFVPPEGIRPGHMGTLWDEVAHPLDVSAMIVDLAVRGYLRIDEVAPPAPGNTLGLGRRDGDYNFVQLKEPDSDLLSAEQVLLQGLFRDGPEAQLSELRQHFAERLKLVEGALYDDAVAAGWFPARPDRVRARWHGIGIVALVVGAGLAFLLIRYTRLGLLALPLPLLGVLLLIFGSRFPHRSARGTALLGRVRGFKELFDAGEGERQRFLESKQLFSQYLPYAIVFGMAAQWAATFEALGLTPEEMGVGSWYMSPYGYNPIAFGYAMSSFSTTTTGSIAAATPSSTSGGSGFSSGGGFSGGGFGGGGGGSW